MDFSIFRIKNGGFNEIFIVGIIRFGINSLYLHLNQLLQEWIIDNLIGLK